MNSVTERFDFVSLIHVFSHLPDLRDSSDVPTELDLPDHLVFAGERHIVGYLEEASFEVIEIVHRPTSNLYLCEVL